MEWIESSENGACRIEIPYGIAVFDDIELVIRSYAEADKVLLAEEILVVPVAPVIVEDYVAPNTGSVTLSISAIMPCPK